MSKIANKNTRPERQVRSRLFSAGFRFRLHDKRLPGSPDIVLPRFRTAVFVNGCFWHGHLCLGGRKPKSNTNLWDRKIKRTIERDVASCSALTALGWRVHTIWTCQLEADTAHLLDLLGAVDAERAVDA